MQSETDWVETQKLQLVDRSDLEMVDCPQSMQFVRKGIVLNSSLAMDSGNAVHDALSGATRQYVLSRGALNAGEVMEEARQNVLHDSRVDLIHDSCDGLMPSVNRWSWFLTKIHPDNLLRFDGGEGIAPPPDYKAEDRSGQLAMDFPDLGLRCTSEVDLLYAGTSPELLHEVDYKSGFKRWTQATVENAFQFRFHACLIFHNHPELAAVEIRVWNTRWNDLTYGVVFKRERDFERLMVEVRRRAEIFKRYKDKDPDQCPANPDETRCLQCPALAICVLSKNLAEPIANPERYLQETAAMQKTVEARLDLLKEAVRRTGSDIVAPDGTCFGFNKPKAERKPKAAMYTTKAEEESAE